MLFRSNPQYQVTAVRVKEVISIMPPSRYQAAPAVSPVSTPPSLPGGIQQHNLSTFVASLPRRAQTQRTKNGRLEWIIVQGQRPIITVVCRCGRMDGRGGWVFVSMGWRWISVGWWGVDENSRTWLAPHGIACGLECL